MKLNVANQEITAGRVFCIGCNYAEHVRELHGFEEIPPVVFMKPADALVAAGSVAAPPPGYSERSFGYLCCIETGIRRP